MASSAEKLVRSMLDKAGIAINGDRPWDIQVHDDRLYRKLLTGGSLAAGETYMDGWWDVVSLEEFFTRIFKAGLEREIRRPIHLLTIGLMNLLFNLQSRRRAHIIGERHYNAGNDLFSRMLDSTMTYSCGYWKDAGNLEEAQQAKLDLICRKLGLEAGMRLLDIGCGWGGLVKFATENYGVEATGITVSTEQVDEARKRCTGLPVNIEFMDYRALDETFDRIVSVGMVEHVGHKNYREFMRVAKRCLEPGGLFLLHTIGSNRSVYASDAWIVKYIFPNSMLPSIAQLSRAAEGLFTIEDLHSFGPHYDRTLMAWSDNLKSRWSEIADKYGERFFRMWNFYLMTSAASFRTRRIQLWQMVLAKPPYFKTYQSIR